jgi:hypothetical protein
MSEGVGQEQGNADRSRSREIGSTWVGLVGGIAFLLGGLLFVGQLINYQIIYGHAPRVSGTVLTSYSASKSPNTVVALSGAYAGDVATLDNRDTISSDLSAGQRVTVLVDPGSPQHAILPYILDWYVWLAAFGVILIGALGATLGIRSLRQLAKAEGD